MALYTFVMDFLGGTYMAQVRAASVRSACVKWARTVDVRGIPGLGPTGKEALIANMLDRDRRPVPIAGLRNAWCTSTLIRGRFALINIVRTEERVERRIRT